MEVLILSGGGRPEGATAALAGAAAAAFEAAGAEVRIVDLADRVIGYCTGCDECRTAGRCHMRDDMDGLTAAVLDCDVLVIATPVRFNGASSAAKRFIERFQPYWFSPVPANDGLMSAIVCGGSEKPNFGGAVGEIRALRSVLGRRWAEPLLVPGTDTDGPESSYDECAVWAHHLLEESKR